jgi:hypothetical protein
VGRKFENVFVSQNWLKRFSEIWRILQWIQISLPLNEKKPVNNYMNIMRKLIFDIWDIIKTKRNCLLVSSCLIIDHIIIDISCIENNIIPYATNRIRISHTKLDTLLLIILFFMWYSFETRCRECSMVVVFGKVKKNYSRPRPLLKFSIFC